MEVTRALERVSTDTYISTIPLPEEVSVVDGPCYHPDLYKSFSGKSWVENTIFSLELPEGRSVAQVETAAPRK